MHGIREGIQTHLGPAKVHWISAHFLSILRQCSLTAVHKLLQSSGRKTNEVLAIVHDDVQCGSAWLILLYACKERHAEDDPGSGSFG
jgi:hypothetical protein